MITSHRWNGVMRRKLEYLSREYLLAQAGSVTDNWSCRPLNSVGLPYYREVLASAWPDLVSDVGAPPVRFDAQFLAGLKSAEFGSYGRNTRGLRRNQAEDTRNSHRGGSTGLKAPKFLSEKAREVAISDSRALGDKLDEISIAVGDNEGESKASDVPVMYRSVEIKYSKFGVDDFDFGFYNKTRYSGLETHISNSYANSLLQIMHFTPLIRNLALQHAATACVGEICLLCELGFLFDMLQKADGSICQATNLLKALSSHPQGTFCVFVWRIVLPNSSPVLICCKLDLWAFSKKTLTAHH